MSNDDEHLLAGYDLAAWEAPPPSAGLADAVIARARQPAAAAAHDVPSPASPTRWRWWIGGATGAAAVVAIMFGVFSVQRQPAYVQRAPEPREQLAAGGGSDDARIAELKDVIKKLEDERDRLRAELEAKTAELTGVKTARRPPAPSAPACDATPFREKGDDLLSDGRDAAALLEYEAAYRCETDALLLKKMFLASCRSNNATKAKQYYPKLPANARDALRQICARNGIDPRQVAPTGPVAPLKPKSLCQRGAMNPSDPRPACTGGILEVMGAPQAKILIDGVDTKKLTPAWFDLAPGPHKVTYVIDGNRYTFAVTVKADETVTLSKVLE